MIPLLDSKAQYAAVKAEVDRAVKRVLSSGQYVSGPEVAAFEKKFADYCGAKHAIAVNTGSSALHLALLAAGVGPGDEVITIPFTFVASVAAITWTGARPVLVDIDPVTCLMDPAELEAAITPRTKAILPVHLYGQICDSDPILSIAEAHGLAVIEDAAQAHGAEYHGRRAGSIGLSGCFSFYAGKNLGACGEGGAITTSDDEQARRIRMLRDWGQKERYNHVVKGFNFRMDELQAAILSVKLDRLDEWNEARRRCARRYGALLAGRDSLTLPHEAAGRRHVYHIYAVRSADRDALRRRLADRGVQSGLHYPIPVHLMEAHADLGHGPGDFPHSEAAAREVLSLPIFPELTEEQAETVAAALGAPVYA